MIERNRKQIFIQYSTSVILGFALLMLFTSCVGITEVDPANSSRSNKLAYFGNYVGQIYPDNPVALTGKKVTRADFDGYLQNQVIVENEYLETKCAFTQYFPETLDSSQLYPYTDTSVDECLVTLNDMNTNTQVLQAQNQNWSYPVESDEFYQVNTFYHINSLVERYLESLSFVHKYVHLESNMIIPPATKYNLVDTGTYWLTDDDGLTKTVKSYTNCFDVDDLTDLNASFSPADDSLCFGISSSKRVKMVQDPSVIYHEVGHALIKLMMNQRNVTVGVDPLSPGSTYFEAHPFKSYLGEIFYDEAGAINEAIADYFSYYMNKRNAVAEFAFNLIQHNYRPLSEDEEAHGADVSTTTEGRVSYPQFVHYDPTYPDKKIEDIHYASAIASHYFVALTNEFKNQCTFSATDEDTIHKEATDYMMLLFNETLAEVGDLTAKGSDLFSRYATGDFTQQNIYFTNLNKEQSYLWTQIVNPPNFRRFFRIFGKNILHYISTGLCPSFDIDESEKLLDDYGLLLFKSYEDRGNGLHSLAFTSHSFQDFAYRNVFNGRNLIPFTLNTQVNEANRRKSILISKNFLTLDQESSAFIIDGQTDIKRLLSSLTYEGENVTVTEGLAGPEYNNNNVKVSPGEVVALSLNIFNNSNSVMGGVQFLANDWDHMKLNNPTELYVGSTTNLNGLGSGDISGGIASHSPCIIDGFPLESEGGVQDSDSTMQGNCSHITKNNKLIDTSEIVGSTTYSKYDYDAPQPICMVQYRDENETKWVTQDFYRKYALGLEDSDCLNNPSMSGSGYNPNECLIRVLPGAAQGVLGKIDPQSTWSKTILNEGETKFKFDAGHLVLMEVNKWITPGTKFNCRFRARFTNCSDCFDEFNFGDAASSLQDYPDFSYAGHAPYKVINLQFTVLD